MWYGKWTFIFVELPRRFMVSIFALLVFRHFMPMPWMEWALMAACLAFDLLVVRRAPDIQATREEIERQLALGTYPVFLTWSDLKTRLAWLTLGALLLLGIAYYWYANGQQPVLLSQLLTGSVVLAAIAYVSALGIPIRAQRDVPEGETPCLWPIMPFVPHREEQRRTAALASFIFGLPPFYCVAWVILYYMIKGMGPFEGGLGFTGEFLIFIQIAIGGYSLLLGCILTMPMAIYTSKLRAVRTQETLLSHLSPNKE